MRTSWTTPLVYQSSVDISIRLESNFEEYEVFEALNMFNDEKALRPNGFTIPIDQESWTVGVVSGYSYSSASMCFLTLASLRQVLMLSFIALA